ncbi:MAG: hypothetical protein HQL62_02105 [Magnetococcales bacterium]|nr:hypothetical protein [Magnetococcales bacterium]
MPADAGGEAEGRREAELFMVADPIFFVVHGAGVRKGEWSMIGESDLLHRICFFDRNIHASCGNGVDRMGDRGGRELHGRHGARVAGGGAAKRQGGCIHPMSNFPTATLPGMGKWRMLPPRLAGQASALRVCPGCSAVW